MGLVIWKVSAQVLFKYKFINGHDKRFCQYIGGWCNLLVKIFGFSFILKDFRDQTYIYFEVIYQYMFSLR